MSDTTILRFILGAGVGVGFGAGDPSGTQTDAATAPGGDSGSNVDEPADSKPTETVDFWKSKAREQEKRAKENAAAAKQLAEIQDAQKTDAEKAADRISKAEAEVASVPAKVADALRTHLVALHGIDAEDAELFLTAAEPELLLKQVERLVGQSDKRKKNHVPREGNPTNTGGADPVRDFTKNLFASAAND